MVIVRKAQELNSFFGDWRHGGNNIVAPLIRISAAIRHGLGAVLSHRRRQPVGDLLAPFGIEKQFFVLRIGKET